MFTLSLSLASVKAARFDTCFSPVTAWHGAPRVGQCHRFRLGVRQQKPVYTSPANNWATLSDKGDVDLLQLWSDLDPFTLVGTSIFSRGDPNSY